MLEGAVTVPAAGPRVRGREVMRRSPQGGRGQPRVPAGGRAAERSPHPREKNPRAPGNGRPRLRLRERRRGVTACAARGGRRRDLLLWGCERRGRWAGAAFWREGAREAGAAAAMLAAPWEV